MRGVLFMNKDPKKFAVKKLIIANIINSTYSTSVTGLERLTEPITASKGWLWSFQKQLSDIKITTLFQYLYKINVSIHDLENPALNIELELMELLHTDPDKDLDLKFAFSKGIESYQKSHTTTDKNVFHDAKKQITSDIAVARQGITNILATDEKKRKMHKEASNLILNEITRQLNDIK